MIHNAFARMKAPLASALLAPFVGRHLCIDCVALALVLALLRLAAS